MKRHLSSLLGLAAGVLCIFSSLNSFVTVVPWCEYDFYQTATAFCALSFMFAFAWLVLNAHRRRYVRCGVSCVCLLLSGFFLFVNSMTFSGLFCVRNVGMSMDSFSSVCAAAHTVAERIEGRRDWTLTKVSSCRRPRSQFCQISLVARNEDGEELWGSSCGDGSWSIQRRKNEPESLPKRNVEEVFREILARDPSVISNDDIAIEWSSQDGTWSIDCYSVREHRTAGYSISEDFSGFRKWGD